MTDAKPVSRERIAEIREHYAELFEACDAVGEHHTYPQDGDVRDLLSFLALAEARAERLRKHADAMAKASESPSPTIMRRAADRYRAEFPSEARASLPPPPATEEDER